MSAGTSLASDFSPVPQVMLAHTRQAFVARSNAMLGLMAGSPGSGAAIEQIGDPGFGMGGQYLEAPGIANSIAVNSRDITSTSGLTAQKLAGFNNRGVVVHRRTDLVEFADDTRWAGWNREQLSAECGKQLGEKLVDDMLSTVIAALIGACDAVGSSAHIYSPWSATVRTNLSPSVIDAARQLMGDRGDILKFLITRSQSMVDLRADAVGRSYDAVGGRALAGADGTNIFGLVHALRDDANLTASDAGFDKYITLLLGAGAISIGFPQAVEIETIRVISNETKSTQWRADWSLSVQVPTMQYDGSSSNANPSNSGLATAANWTDNTTSDKEVPIVKIVHNYSGN